VHSIKLLLNNLKLNFPTYNWFCADGSHLSEKTLTVPFTISYCISGKMLHYYYY